MTNSFDKMTAEKATRVAAFLQALATAAGDTTRTYHAVCDPTGPRTSYIQQIHSVSGFASRVWSTRTTVRVKAA